MRALAELSNVNNISSTTLPVVPTYSLSSKSQEYLLLSEISLGMDASFLSVGSVQIKINGLPITNQSTPGNTAKFINNYTFNFNGDKMFVFVEPGQDVQVSAMVSSASGNIQIGVNGMRLTPEEFDLVQKKYLGKATWLDDLKLMLLSIFKRGSL